MSNKQLACKSVEVKESSKVARTIRSQKLVKGYAMGKVYLSPKGWMILNRWSVGHD